MSSTNRTCTRCAMGVSRTAEWWGIAPVNRKGLYRHNVDANAFAPRNSFLCFFPGTAALLFGLPLRVGQALTPVALDHRLDDDVEQKGDACRGQKCRDDQPELVEIHDVYSGYPGEESTRCRVRAFTARGRGVAGTGAAPTIR